MGSYTNEIILDPCPNYLQLIIHSLSTVVISFTPYTHFKFWIYIYIHAYNRIYTSTRKTRSWSTGSDAHCGAPPDPTWYLPNIVKLIMHWLCYTFFLMKPNSSVNHMVFLSLISPFLIPPSWPGLAMRPGVFRRRSWPWHMSRLVGAVGWDGD